MIKVQAPDGTVIEFPEGTPDSVILDVMRREYGGQPSGNDLSAMGGNLYAPENAAMFAGESGEQASALDPVSGNMLPGVNTGLAAMQGYTFGGSDELLSRAVAAAFPDRTPQPMLREQMQDDMDQFRAESPVAAYGAEITGAMLNPLTYIGGGGGNLGTRMATNAGIGGLLSGAYGFFSGEGGAGERAVNAIPSALFGAGVGGAIPLLGAGVQRGVNNLLENRAVRAAARVAPSMDDLRAVADGLYAQADAAAPMPRAGLVPIAQGIVDEPKNINLDSMLVPQAAQVSNNITEAATSPAPTIGFRELDILRRQAQVPAGDIGNRTQSAIGTRMIDGIDQFIDQADPNLSAVVGQARDMWSRLRKSEVIEQAIERARNQASGFENGIRVQFRAILNNPARLRGFSEQEVSAIRAVVRGTPMGNLMRTVGKFGIDVGQNTNAVGAALGVGAGGAMGSLFGPVGSAIGAVAFPAIASVSRAGANATTRAAANRVQGLLTSGGVQNVPQLTNATRSILEQMVRPAVPITGLLASQP